jgi:hypothetical protein
MTRAPAPEAMPDDLESPAMNCNGSAGVSKLLARRYILLNAF